MPLAVIEKEDRGAGDGCRENAFLNFFFLFGLSFRLG
jgi:hypothetical protein